MTTIRLARTIALFCLGAVACSNKAPEPAPGPASPSNGDAKVEAPAPSIRAIGDYWPACEGEGVPFARPYSGAVDRVISLVRYTDAMPFELLNAKLAQDPSENGTTPPVSTVLCIEMARTQLENTCPCDYPPSPTGDLRAPREPAVVHYHRGEGVIRLVRADTGEVLRTRPFTISGASCPDPCITTLAERHTTADMSEILLAVVESPRATVP